MQPVKSILLASLLALPMAAWSHSAPLSKDGCHEDKRFGEYHCHEGVLKDRRFKTEDEARQALIQAAITPRKKSSAGEPEGDRDPS